MNSVGSHEEGDTDDGDGDDDDDDDDDDHTTTTLSCSTPVNSSSRIVSASFFVGVAITNRLEK